MAITGPTWYPAEMVSVDCSVKTGVDRSVWKEGSKKGFRRDGGGGYKSGDVGQAHKGGLYPANASRPNS